jgi:ATP-dependent Clp protease ATP-binding subunit ClpA
MRRFAADARTIVRRAETEARADGSPSIEAEHLLLALTIQPDATAARLLATAGLDHDTLHDALEGQFRDALAAAGVELTDGGPPPRRASSGQHLRMGQSGKLALQRALTATAKLGDKRIKTPHVLIGILRAEHGTIARALARAKIDREQLIAAAEAALTAPAS